MYLVAGTATIAHYLKWHLEKSLSASCVNFRLVCFLVRLARCRPPVFGGLMARMSRVFKSGILIVLGLGAKWYNKQVFQALFSCFDSSNIVTHTIHIA